MDCGDCSRTLADSADFGFRPAASFHQHAASIQTAIGHVDGRVDTDGFRNVCCSRFNRAGNSDIAPVRWRDRSNLNVAAGILIFGSAIFGTLLATYTGVLIGATAIPAWFLHHKLLPIHFGTAGLGSAAALLELLGHRIAPLNAIGFLAAAVETVLLIWLSIDKHGVADRAIHEHGSGWVIRIGGVLTGPLPLLLRFFGAIPLAAISFLLGALVSRFGWIAVGKISGRDPEAVFASQKL